MQALSQDTQIGSSDGVCRVVRSVFTACLVCSIAHTMRNTSDPRIVLDSGCQLLDPKAGSRDVYGDPAREEDPGSRESDRLPLVTLRLLN